MRYNNMVDTKKRGLEYHFIKNSDWRKENPALDTLIEDTVTQFANDSIPFKDFCEKMNGYIDVTRQTSVDGRLSNEAIINYLRIYSLIVNQYFENEKDESDARERQRVMRAKDIRM